MLIILTFYLFCYFDYKVPRKLNIFNILLIFMYVSFQVSSNHHWFISKTIPLLNVHF